MTVALIDLEAQELVKQLSRVGGRPPEKLVQRILAFGEVAIEPLLELATEADDLFDDIPTAYGPVHALRLLGELKSPRITEQLLLMYPMEDAVDTYPYTDERELYNIWDSELPQILGSLGSRVVDQLWEFADDAGNTHLQRSAALTGLAYATAVEPELREPIIAGLRERMTKTDDPTMAAYHLTALVNLQVPEYYADVMSLYREGRINRDILPPAQARQYLLQKNPHILDCAKHPLWERYNIHRLD